MDSYERGLAAVLSDDDEDGEQAFVYPGSSTSAPDQASALTTAAGHGMTGNTSVLSISSDASSTVRASNSRSTTAGDFWSDAGPSTSTSSGAGGAEADGQEEDDTDTAAWNSLPPKAVRKQDALEEAALEWQHDPRWEDDDAEPSSVRAAAGRSEKGGGKLDMREYNRQMREIMGDEGEDGDDFSADAQSSAPADDEKTPRLPESAGAGSEAEDEEEEFSYPGASSSPSRSPVNQNPQQRSSFKRRPPSPEPLVLSVGRNSSAKGKGKQEDVAMSNRFKRVEELLRACVDHGMEDEARAICKVSTTECCIHPRAC